MMKKFTQSNCIVRLCGVIMTLTLPFAGAYGASVRQADPPQARSIMPDSTAAIHGSDFTRTLSNLQGGIRIVSTDGAPGAAKEILLRGISSIRSTQQPLILVDGVELNTMITPTANPWRLIYPYTNQRGEGALSDPDLDQLYRQLLPTDYQVPVDLFSMLDLASIESIEVLRNTSATALYGTRGANGVVLIKTRTECAQKRIIQLSSSVGVSSTLRRLDYLSPSQFDAFYRQLTGGAYPSAASVDWQERLYAPSVSTTNRLELSGRGMNTNYGLKLLYGLENGVVEGTSRQYFSLNTYVDQRLSRMFTSGIKFDITRTDLSMTQSTALIGSQSTITLLDVAPYDDVPFSAVGYADDYEDISKLWNIMPRGYVKGQFGRMVTLHVEGGVDVVTSQRGRWAGNGTQEGKALNGIAGMTFFDKLNYDATMRLSVRALDRSRNKLEMEVAGFYFGDRFANKSIQGIDFFNHALKSTGVKLASNNSKQYYATYATQHVGALLKADYAFDERYELRGGVRADKNLDIKGDLHYFPFAEVRWNLAKEPFLHSLLSGVVSSLSLRGGWGRSGTDNLMPYFLSSYYSIALDPQQIPYAEQMRYETRQRSVSEQYNIGLELGLLQDRIRADVNFYDGDVCDEVSVNYTFDRSLSEPVVARNRMYMDKRGVEVSLGATPVSTKDWRWEVQATVAFDRNRITDAGSEVQVAQTGAVGFEGREVGQGQRVTAFLEGYAPGVFVGYRTEGIVGEQHVDFTPPFGDTKLQPGDIKFIDMNRDGVVDPADRVVIGDPNPKFVGSFAATLRYRGWSLAMDFSGSYGNDVLNLNLLRRDNLSEQGNVLRSSYEEAWSAANPTGRHPAVGAFGYDQISDRLVEDGSHVRLSNLVISYDFALRKIKWLSGLQVSLMARNLFVLSSYSGYDPAVDSFLGDWSLRGIDLGAYPSMRSVSLGVKVKF